MTLPDFVWGAIGAAVSWPVVEFLARPFRQFFDIRRQVARCLVEYANVGARALTKQTGELVAYDLAPEDDARLVKAQEAYRGLADMRAFANGEWAANKAVMALGYNPNEIASALLGVSNILPIKDKPCTTRFSVLGSGPGSSKTRTCCLPTSTEPPSTPTTSALYGPHGQRGRDSRTSPFTPYGIPTPAN
jgi:hypothetical protein